MPIFLHQFIGAREHQLLKEWKWTELSIIRDTGRHLSMNKKSDISETFMLIFISTCLVPRQKKIIKNSCASCHAKGTETIQPRAVLQRVHWD